jgi:hypothetical protein
LAFFLFWFCDFFSREKISLIFLLPYHQILLKSKIILDVSRFHQMNTLFSRQNEIVFCFVFYFFSLFTKLIKTFRLLQELNQHKLSQQSFPFLIYMSTPWRKNWKKVFISRNFFSQKIFFSQMVAHLNRLSTPDDMVWTISNGFRVLRITEKWATGRPVAVLRLSAMRISYTHA